MKPSKKTMKWAIIAVVALLIYMNRGKLMSMLKMNGNGKGNGSKGANLSSMPSTVYLTTDSQGSTVSVADQTRVV